MSMLENIEEREADIIEGTMDLYRTLIFEKAHRIDKLIRTELLTMKIRGSIDPNSYEDAIDASSTVALYNAVYNAIPDAPRWVKYAYLNEFLILQKKYHDAIANHAIKGIIANNHNEFNRGDYPFKGITIPETQSCNSLKELSQYKYDSMPNTDGNAFKMPDNVHTIDGSYYDIHIDIVMDILEKYMSRGLHMFQACSDPNYSRAVDTFGHVFDYLVRAEDPIALSFITAAVSVPAIGYATDHISSLMPDKCFVYERVKTTPIIKSYLHSCALSIIDFAKSHGLMYSSNMPSYTTRNHTSIAISNADLLNYIDNAIPMAIANVGNHNIIPTIIAECIFEVLGIMDQNDAACFYDMLHYVVMNNSKGFYTLILELKQKGVFKYDVHDMQRILNDISWYSSSGIFNDAVEAAVKYMHVEFDYGKEKSDEHEQTDQGD